MSLFITIILAVIMLVVGLILGYAVRKSIHEKQLAMAHNTADSIIADAKKKLKLRKKRHF
ncbi:hypothetical protein ATO00_06970 [Loigolactobacillus coryniformis subsp. coryniformis]|nr:hypothetical protein ATO00_06970 [Loigolactobacillus coryniformis subsp. coryniformis]